VLFTGVADSRGCDDGCLSRAPYVDVLISFLAAVHAALPLQFIEASGLVIACASMVRTRSCRSGNHRRDHRLVMLHMAIVGPNETAATTCSDWRSCSHWSRGALPCEAATIRASQGMMSGRSVSRGSFNPRLSWDCFLRAGALPPHNFFGIASGLVCADDLGTESGSNLTRVSGTFTTR